MIYAIKKSEQRLAPEIKPKGYYVDITWERLVDTKEVRRKYTIGPFPESSKELLVEFMDLLERLHLRKGGASLYPQVEGYDKWFSGKPYDTPLGLVITTPHDDLDENFQYQITSYWGYYCDGTSVSPQYVETVDVSTNEPQEPAKSSFLAVLPQYHFERSVFVTAFTSILGSDLCDQVQDMCITDASTVDFKFTMQDGEYYVIHLPSGTIINWYKHLGRTNTCNKPGFGLDDLQEMLLLLKQELQELPD